MPGLYYPSIKRTLIFSKAKSQVSNLFSAGNVFRLKEGFDRMMRKTALLSVIVVMLFSACGKKDPAVSLAKRAAAAEKADSRIVQAINSFGLELYRNLAAAYNGKNVLISPASISMALAMTYTGAAGPTREAIAKALKLDGLTAEEVNKGNAC
jgi:serpin B